MHKVIADQEQRQRALIPEQSFIVQAPAGSGKTELLIQRYLSLLSLVEHPEEIVAITFTRKAAIEMQGRIVTALEQARTKQLPQDGYAKTSYELASKVLAQDEKYAWQLLNNPGRMRIQTIDALSAWLTRQMPILSGFGAQPGTIDDATQLYQEAANNTLEELEADEAWSDAIAVLLTHLDNDLPRIRNMLATMLRRRDQWLRHITTELRRDKLESALKHLVESSLKTLRQTVEELALAEELLALLRYAAGNLAQQDSASPINYGLDIDQLPGYLAADLCNWQGIATLLLTTAGKWRQSARTDIGFPAASGNKAEAETRKAMKDRFTALLANFSRDDELLKQLQEVQSLPPITYTENEWQLVNALCQLLILADAQLRVLFAERNQVDFSGITQAATQALGNAEAPSDLALHLDYQIKHILVDEYQDISINQYILIQQLTAGWSAGDNHSLFLVGDPMQSIYRFREAEVGLFLNTWQARRLGQVLLTPITITVNFRSQAGIVHWVNDTFKQVYPARSDIGRGAVSYVEAVAYDEANETDAVSIHPILGRDESIEAAKVVHLIKAAKGSDPNGNIAILVRNRNHLQQIVPALKQAGLRFRAIEIEALGQRPVIQDLSALTCALNHCADRIAWLAMLRAPWCGLILADLFTLTHTSRHQAIWECIQDDTRIQALTADGQQRITKLREVLERAFTEQKRRSLRRWVESVWLQLGGPATVEEATDLENAQTFFELLDEYDEAGDLKNRDRFLQQVTTLYASPDVSADDGLQIMTIHKAKGLEFDTVIIPGLSRGSGRDDPSLLLWTENPYAAHQNLLLAPIKDAGEKDSPMYDFLKKLEREKQRHEEGRLLYVATTRAKKRLHLIGNVDVKTTSTEHQLKTPRTNSLLAQLWPVVKTTYEQALSQYDDNTSDAERDRISNDNPLRRLTSAWTLPLPPKAVTWRSYEISGEVELAGSEIEYQWAGETIMHIGTVVHRCIQIIAEEGIDNWNEERIRLRHESYCGFLKRLGVMEKEISWASNRVEEALVKMLHDERGQWLLAPEHTEAKNEYAISGMHHGKIINVVIDRTFVDDQGSRWVVDYKTSRHEGPGVEDFLEQEQERYREQLEKYGTLIQHMDNRPVKLGLYFPLLQGWREWELAEP